MTSIIDVIYTLCEDQGITITQLERELGFSKYSIPKWREHDPPVTKILAIANYFNVPVDYIVQYDKYIANLVGNNTIAHQILNGIDNYCLTYKDIQALLEMVKVLKSTQNEPSKDAKKEEPK